MFDEFGYKEARTGCVQIQQTGGGLGLGLFQDTSAADSRCALRVSVVPEATGKDIAIVGHGAFAVENAWGAQTVPAEMQRCQIA